MISITQIDAVDFAAELYNRPVSDSAVTALTEQAEYAVRRVLSCRDQAVSHAAVIRLVQNLAQSYDIPI